MTPPLTPAQKQVVEKMRDGWELRCGGANSARFAYLVGADNRVQRLKIKDFYVVKDARIIHRTGEYGFHDVYSLTPLGLTADLTMEK